MIKQLQKRFIAISAAVICMIFALIFVIAYLLNVSSVNQTLDTLTDILSENDGTFPENSGGLPSAMQGSNVFPSFINKETPFSTRFFTVWLNEEDEIVATNIESISSVTKEDAEDYARSAVIKGKERGWIEDYRYKIYDATIPLLSIIPSGNFSNFPCREIRRFINVP